MHRHHVIIGDGITAAEFATTRTVRAGDSITVIGQNVHELGRGVAYASTPSDAPWRYAYLLNSPVRSVDTEFANWLEEHWEYVATCMAGRSPDWLSAAHYYVNAGQHASLNAPREFFGDFFHARTMGKIKALRAEGIQVHLIQAQVERIECSDTGLTVVTSDNKVIQAHSVDVASGGPQNQRIVGDDDEHSFPALFGNEYTIADKLSSGGHIVCIGAAAAMLDLLRFCQSIQTKDQIRFTALSPSGKILKALRPPLHFTPSQYKLKGTFSTADDFLSAITALQQQALAKGDSLYETRVGLRALFLNKQLIEFVPDITEARKVSVPLFKHFEGGTRDSIDDFHRLAQTGQAQIIAGKVQHIKQVNDHAHVCYTDNTGQQQLLKATVVVNCAGPGQQRRFDALTLDMLRQNWISICPQSGGILVGEGGRCTVEGVRYLGPAVTSIGNSVEPVPLYDALRLRRAAQRFNNFSKA